MNTTTNILIIEDEPSMRLGLRDNLEIEGYHVDTASDGEEGLSKIRTSAFDLILLDVMLPKVSGFDVCKTARVAGIRTPIILLTAKGEEIDKLIGLELGADDYITKPFSVRELLARIKAILRRSQPVDKSVPVITIGKLSIDFAAFQIRDSGEDVKLSHKEFEILSYLFKNKNQVVTRYDLLENVWGYEEQITTRTVDNFIVRLRQKIEENPNQPKIILTVHGEGYKMIL
jgi:DNA-binding response OmpR family regulator